MAHGRPWYQRNGSDMLLGVMHFPDIEHRWAYSAIIDMLNDRDRPIPDDAGFITGFTGLTRKKWSIVRAYLLAHRGSDGQPDKLILTASGDISNPRFERERARRGDARKAMEEGGSKGGKRSGEARAEKARKSADSTPDSTPESGVESTLESTPDHAAKAEVASPENKHLAEAPPSNPLARAPASEARDESLEEESSTTASSEKVGVEASATGPADVADETWDLLGTTNRLARIGGVSLHRESARLRAMDLVKSWLADGIDLEKTIIPAIEAQFRDTKESQIGGLEFYAGRIAKEHAKVGPERPPVTAAQLQESARTSAALYRRMGRHGEADEIERSLQAGASK